MNTNILYTFILLFGFLTINSYSQNCDKAMQQILKDKRAFNETNTETEGFRIQLYNGLSETSAKGRQNAFVAFFPEINTYLIYEQPEWKVQTHSFKTKIEAYKTWLKVKEEFEGTFIFEEKK